MDFVTSFRNSVLQYFNNYQKVHKKIANQYSGRCFILGNGPSLNEQDLSLLRNEHCFVTNRFVLHNNFEVVDPNFYCMADPEFLVKNERIILPYFPFAGICWRFGLDIENLPVIVPPLSPLI